jgi:chromosome partitioning protein
MPKRKNMVKKPRKISIYNAKGGVDKSSIAENISHALAIEGHKVLLVECDMQRNASSILLEEPVYTITDVITERALFSQAIHKARENFFIVPADEKLDRASNYIISGGRKAYNTLRKMVEKLDTYDFILFDHSPSWSALAHAAFLASDELLVPCRLEPFAIDGLFSMFNKLQDELEDHEIAVTGIIPTSVDFSSNMTHQYLEKLKEAFKEKVTCIIRQDKQVPRSQAYKRTILEHNPKSKASKDIHELVQWIINAGDTNNA